MGPGELIEDRGKIGWFKNAEHAESAEDLLERPNLLPSLRSPQSDLTGLLDLEGNIKMGEVSPYPPPVDRLLTYGDCRELREWPDYVSELGLGPEHIPDLIRMATDEDLKWADSDSLEVWAPVHAWRALGQLKAEEAMEPLMSLFDDLDDAGDDWVLEELPTVYGMIGPAAISTLSAYLADPSHGESPRIAITDCLENIAKEHPEAYDECVAILTRQLERFEENLESLNGFLVSSLVTLKAMESVPIIERAFAADRVDESIHGDWEDVQVELGLKPFRERPRRPLFFGRDEDLDTVPLTPYDSGTASERKARRKAKAKRKQAKKSRKINRKKKKKKK